MWSLLSFTRCSMQLRFAQISHHLIHWSTWRCNLMQSVSVRLLTGVHRTNSEWLHQKVFLHLVQYQNYCIDSILVSISWSQLASSWSWFASARSLTASNVDQQDQLVWDSYIIDSICISQGKRVQDEYSKKAIISSSYYHYLWILYWFDAMMHQFDALRIRSMQYCIGGIGCWSQF